MLAASALEETSLRPLRFFARNTLTAAQAIPPAGRQCFAGFACSSIVRTLGHEEPGASATEAGALYVARARPRGDRESGVCWSTWGHPASGRSLVFRAWLRYRRNMTDKEAGELLDWLLQTLHAGEIALDAIAHGEIPDGWEEMARQLSAAQDALRGPTPHVRGRLVEDADVAALARLRALVASGSVEDEARRLAVALRHSFSKAPGCAA